MQRVFVRAAVFMLVLVAIVASPSAARASTIVYADSSSWLAATTGVSTNSFDMAGTSFIVRGPSFTDSGATYTAHFIASMQDSYGGDAPYHPNGYLDWEGFSSKGMSFASPITARSR